MMASSGVHGNTLGTECGHSHISRDGGQTFHLYKSFKFESNSWRDANRRAGQQLPFCDVQGHLATIHDAEENDLVLRTPNYCGGNQESQSAWIGLNDETEEGTFKWSNNEPVSYYNWCPKQPSAGPAGRREDFVHIYIGSPPNGEPGCWNDLNNFGGGSGGVAGGVDNYIVEFDEVPCGCQQLVDLIGTAGQCPGPGVMTDPHFLVWNGTMYDFMGACDLHLNEAPALDLTIDIRTKIRYRYSFIESAAIRLGDDILEVGSYGTYFFNGVEGSRLPKWMDNKHLVSYNMINKKKSEFVITLDQGERIRVGVFKDMVSIKIENAGQAGRFRDSVGMMGEYGTGKLLGRDGKTLLENDLDELAAEWQVRDNEPMLFQSSGEGPKYPQACEMPVPVKENSRRLGETVALEAAKEACAHYHQGQKAKFEACVHDVMATGDLEMADAGAF